MLLSAIKYVNPLYYTVVLPLQFLCWLVAKIFWLPTSMLNTVKWAWKWYPSWLKVMKFPRWICRAFMVTLAVYAALPATMTATFAAVVITLANKFGYADEVRAFLELVQSVGSFAWAAGKMFFTTIA